MAHSGDFFNGLWVHGERRMKAARREAERVLKLDGSVNSLVHFALVNGVADAIADTMAEYKVSASRALVRIQARKRRAQRTRATA